MSLVCLKIPGDLSHVSLHVNIWIVCNIISGYLVCLWNVQRVCPITRGFLFHVSLCVISWPYYTRICILCVSRVSLYVTMTLSTEIATPQKPSKSRNSDFSVSHSTNSSWAFEFIWMCTEECWVSGFGGYRGCSSFSGNCHKFFICHLCSLLHMDIYLICVFVFMFIYASVCAFLYRSGRFQWPHPARNA